MKVVVSLLLIVLGLLVIRYGDVPVRLPGGKVFMLMNHDGITQKRTRVIGNFIVGVLLIAIGAGTIAGEFGLLPR